MTPRRLPVLFVLIALVAACGASARETALRTSLTALNQARDGFVAFDDTTQSAIVAAATSHEEGTAALAAYREARLPLVAAINAAYQAVSRAAVLDGDLTSAVGLVDVARELWAKLKEWKP